MPRTAKTSKTAKTTTMKPATRAKTAQPPAIRGEKRVKPTDKTVPVGPARRRRGTHDGPTDPAAIDRRKQIVGSDEPGGRRPRVR